MNERRTYSSPLRQQQAEDTRQRIVVAALELVAEQQDGNLSHEAVAKRAEIALRTVYRHFPARTELLDAVWQEHDRRLHLSSYPTTEAELLSSVVPVFAAMDQHAAATRGLITSNAGREMRQRDNERRRQCITTALQSATEHLEDAERKRVVGIFQTLYSGLAWQVLRDRALLEEGEAARAVEWAMRALLDALRRDQARLSRTNQPSKKATSTPGAKALKSARKGKKS